MKKRFIRHNFNMVEIMLAVIVIALGIAGTFVLFPVGVNANKEATADNSIADIAEYVTGFVRAEVLAGSRDDNADEDGSGKVSKGFKSSLISSLFNPDGATPNPSRDYYLSVDVDRVNSSWHVPDTHTGRNKGSEQNADIAMLLSHSSEHGVYLVRQLSGPEGNRFVDFAAVARVYLDNADTENTGLTGAYFPDATGANMVNTTVTAEQQALRNCFLPAILELSWPATAPYGEREKRYFRFEIFNDYYRL